MTFFLYLLSLFCPQQLLCSAIRMPNFVIGIKLSVDHKNPAVFNTMAQRVFLNFQIKRKIAVEVRGKKTNF